MDQPTVKCPWCGEEVKPYEGRTDKLGEKGEEYFFWAYRHSKTDYESFESHQFIVTKRAD